MECIHDNDTNPIHESAEESMGTMTLHTFPFAGFLFPSDSALNAAGMVCVFTN